MCQALAKKGHAVTLCTNRVYPERYIQEEPAFRVVEVDNGKYSFERFDAAANKAPLYYYYGYFRNSYAITSAALKLSVREPFDVVFITDAEFMTASLLLKRYGGRIPPVVMQVNAANFSFRDYPGSVSKKIYKLIQRRIFRRTLGREIKAIAVLGEWHKERLRLQLRLDERFPISVVPDGGEEPKEVVGKAEARGAIDMDYGGPVFLFFGMLRKDKGLGCLLEAVSLIKAEEFKLLIAGSPMDYTEGELKSTIQRLDIAEKVVLRPLYIPDDKVPFYFFASDALVLPYPNIYTGGSGPLMKGACTYSIPVIASDVSEMGRLVSQHKIGLLAEPDNPQSLAEKMKVFLSMPMEEKGRMARNACNLAKANSWDVMAIRFTELFGSIVDTGEKGIRLD